MRTAATSVSDARSVGDVGSSAGGSQRSALLVGPPHIAAPFLVPVELLRFARSVLFGSNSDLARDQQAANTALPGRRC